MAAYKDEASGMLKKDYFERSCIYNRVCVVGKKETVYVLVAKLKEMERELKELANQIVVKKRKYHQRKCKKWKKNNLNKKENIFKKKESFANEKTFRVMFAVKIFRVRKLGSCGPLLSHKQSYTIHIKNEWRRYNDGHL
jgi:hypothetical protein